MPDFSVDIGGLDALSKNLQRTIDNTDSATKRLEKAGTDSLGPEFLDEACSDFRSDWKEGLDKVREAVDKIKDSMNAAKKDYAELEESINKNLEKMESAISKSS